VEVASIGEVVVGEDHYSTTEVGSCWGSTKGGVGGGEGDVACRGGIRGIADA